MIAHLMPLVFAILVRLLPFADPLLAHLPDDAVELMGAGADLGAPDEVGKGSRFGGPRDKKWGGQALACAPDVFTDLEMHVCAHRTLRCGTIVLIESIRTKQRALCRVMDRGPFGALDEHGVWHVEIKLRPGSTYRGFLDMTPSVFDDLELGSRGSRQVRTWVIHVPRKPLRLRPARRVRAAS